MPIPSIRIELLGGLRVVRGSRVTTRFRTHKTAALLAFLAYHIHHSHSRELLIDMLWPDMTPEAGRNSLSMALSSLRSLLERGEEGKTPGSRVVLAGRTTVGLDPLRVTTDTGLFEAALAERTTGPEARLRRLEEAARLYQGALLPGYYEVWILTQQERLQQLCLQGLQELALGRLDVGDRAGALEAAHWATALDPLQEEAQRLVLQLLLESAQPAAALRQYRSLEQHFQAELGVAPDPTTRALVAHLLPDLLIVERSILEESARRPRKQLKRSAQDGLLRSPDVRLSPVLPPRFDRFFGRDRELADVSALLAQPGCLVTLTGTGGVGKTRLALEIAETGAREWQAIFVPLSEVRDADMLLETLRKTLGLPSLAADDPVATIAEHLSRRPLLLILDNFEQIAPEGALAIRELMHRVPTLRCLVTSRVRLLLDLEQEIPLLSLPSPDVTTARNAEHAELLQNPCMALFVDRARASSPGFTITTRNAEALVRLVIQLEGLPLALELAAARAAVLTPRQMLEVLQHRPFDLLAGNQPLLATRHRSLRETIAWSYGLLTPALQRFFRWLSVFHGGWTLEAAEAVTGDPLALDHLAQLEAASLVRAMEGKANESLRFSMLVTLRAYAEEQLDAGTEATEARGRHAAYVSALAMEAAAKMHGPEENFWLQRLDEELDNIRAAFQTWMACAEGQERGLALASDLRWFWCTQGYWEGADWLERALNVAGAAELYAPAERARALQALGQLSRMRHGSAEAVLPLLKESLRIYERLGDENAVAGLLMMRDDDPQMLERGLALCRTTGNEGMLPLALQTLAGHLWRSGDDARAGVLFVESAQLLRRRQDPGLIGLLCEWSYMLMWRGEYRQAACILEECLVLGAELSIDAVSHASWLLGMVRMHTGDYSGALTLIEDSASLRRKLGACQALGSTLMALVQIRILMDDFVGAHATLAEAQAVSEQIEWSVGMAYAHCARGRLALYEGQGALARSIYIECRDNARTLQDPFTGGMSCCGMGWLGVRTQDWAGAEEAFTEGVRLHEAARNERGLMECLQGMACAAAGSMQWDRAARLRGSAQAWYVATGAVLPPLERGYCEQAETATRAAMGEIAFTNALNADMGKAEGHRPALTKRMESGDVERM